MKKLNFSTMIGCLALATAVYFNVKHALNDYGVRDNEKLHPEVMAQAGTTSSGTTNGGTTGNGRTTNSGGSTTGNGGGTTGGGGTTSDDDGGGSMANTCCPIWNITIQTSPTYSRSCTTGGSYKCENCNNCK